MRNVIEYPGSQLSYRMDGQGPVLLLLHGFGESGTIWDSQVEVLLEHATVICPDLPGSGNSPLPEGIHHLSLEAHASLLADMLDQEGIATCTLVGHSLGGYIALAFAEKYPDRLEAFGLFHSTALADTAERREIRKKSIGFMQEHGAGTFLAEVIPNLYAAAFRHDHPETVQHHIDESVAWAKVEALKGYYEAMMARPDRTHILSAFDGPVLMVIGALDKTVALQESLPQARLLKNGRVTIMESVAHMGMREEPEKSSQILLDFIRYTKQR